MPVRSQSIFQLTELTAEAPSDARKRPWPQLLLRLGVCGRVFLPRFTTRGHRDAGLRGGSFKPEDVLGLYFVVRFAFSL